MKIARFTSHEPGNNSILFLHKKVFFFLFASPAYGGGGERNI
jgi:hypothetical protein